MAVAPPSERDVTRILSQHAPLYRWRRPHYQAVMLREMAALWDVSHRKVLDVGGGNGLVAEAIKQLFPVEQVVSIDIADRFAPGLSISTQTYDGEALPFPNRSFDCVVLNNMLHHVPHAARAPLLRECRRVAGGGPLYIKDHLAVSALDHTRLRALDWLGNVPFKGMIEAQYLTARDWDALCRESGHVQTAIRSSGYRGRAFAALFPNRLEQMMKWVPA